MQVLVVLCCLCLHYEKQELLEPLDPLAPLPRSEKAQLVIAHHLWLARRIWSVICSLAWNLVQNVKKQSLDTCAFVTTKQTRITVT